MKARVKWVEGMAFMAESDSGHGIMLDGSPEIGGRNLGARPMEMVLMGLGGCTAIDVMVILGKQRQPVEDCWIELDAERADVAAPKVFTKIHVHYVVKGSGLDPKQVERAVKLSAEKYCSVSAMLKGSVDITYDFEIKS
ncbi:OsmC family protein [Halothiobacillus neapolitanus]|jgi:putative redox protein|uniref:OsmC family protein n=1 Tax=Halothiobacillus neapolitanus (strain ATCC 23641 / DSM 15147 / CIP 104769 / NCIMB 8539 / c2) TaxID=555778 RepID=D0KVN8_HALNC|nr:OsmC family protein [Halothiobacillus neapolitanus]ACX96868.1 OsmC family protein [Halothiobacillus neapolitanus c2]TDN65022.1 putative redox protein [Halothiobacillus neapolitanus]